MVLTHGVMVTLLILVQSFMVRIHMGQQTPQTCGVFIFMVTVYVIESMADKIWYTGIALDARRLTEHNNGRSRFSSGHRPWKLIYTEQQPDWTAARAREKYLKSAAGKIWLKKFFSHK